MKKTLACLLCALLLLPIFAGCASRGSRTLPTLSDEMKIKIAEDYIKIKAFDPDIDPITLWNHGTLLYYGHYAGYDIIGHPGQAMAETGISIGKVVFTYPYAFSLLAYKDGTFEDLKTLYDQSLQNGSKPLLTDQELEELLHIHELHLQEQENTNS